MSRAAAISTTGSAGGRRSAARAGFSLVEKNTPQKDLIRRVKDGFEFSALESLSLATGQTVSELAPHVGIPLRTLARRKSAGKLSMEESERVMRLAGLYEKAAELFGGDVAGARQWMSQPKKALGGETPLEYAGTEIGAREVENLIGRLEHGVFS